MTSTISEIGILHCDRCGGDIDTAKDTSFVLSPSDPSGWRRLCRTCNEVHTYNKIHHPMPPVSFFALIQRFNEMYSLPAHATPKDLGIGRVHEFFGILREEVEELLVINDGDGGIEDSVDRVVSMADLLGDIIVYCASEALRWGIDIEPVLRIIMESNFSKLGPDGRPILDHRKKVMKGPNYFPPEPELLALIVKAMGSR